MACVKFNEKRERWIIDFYDQHGKRRWKTLPKGTNKTQATDELDEVKQRVKRGSYIAPKNKKEALAFCNVAKDWLESKKESIRQNTYCDYKGHIEKHLIGHYGETLVTRIDLNAVERFIKEPLCCEKGHTGNQTNKILRTLSDVMKYACRKKLIDHNPVKDADKPKKSVTLEESEEVEVYTVDEIKRLIDATGYQYAESSGQVIWIEMPADEKMKYKTFMMTAIGTGARQGELIGLKWEDINWQQAQIHIKRTYNHGNFYPPKTKSSIRKIDIAPQLLNALAAWKAKCPVNELNLVFPNGVGNPLNASNFFNRVYKPAIMKAGIKRLKFHSLRHSYASIQIEQNQNIRYISAQMGHSKTSTTLDIYGHLMKTENPEAAKRFGNVVFLNFGSKIVANLIEEKTPNAEILVNRAFAVKSAP